MKTLQQLLVEGGNVFKNRDGSEATQRINQTDVKPTVAWLEQLTGLPLLDNMLGSTGKKPTSGDLDLAVDASVTTKDQLVARLTQWAQSHGQEPKEWIKKSGISVHFKTPITGRASSGFVQTDFMFVTDVSFSKFMLSAAPDSAYKGQDRNILLSSISKAVGYKINQTGGLYDRATNELVTNDPDKIAKLLLNRNATAEHLRSVETILAALANSRNRDAKLADAREYFAKAGIPFDQPVVESESYFLARLRDRIVAQGMQALVEAQRIDEGARIEHPEDLIFTDGARGALQALGAIKRLGQESTGLSVKWDGRPAIIYGRDDNGFALTDKSGFTAKGYNGLARTPNELEAVMSQRSGDRTELVAMYRRIWPKLQSTVPSSFRGFIHGDLLWDTTPPLINGEFVFTPNTVTYRVAQDSPLGKRIGQSSVGVVVHTFYTVPGAPGQPWADVASLTPSAAVVTLTPRFDQQPVLQSDAKRLTVLANYVTANSVAIDAMLNPAALREQKITDLPGMMKKYINAKVRLNDFSNLGTDFMDWYAGAGASQGKVQRAGEHIRDNAKGFGAIFKIFVDITALKQHYIEQLDNLDQSVTAEIGGERGHEGYVYATGEAPIKLVDRLKFSRVNFNKNNPTDDE